MQLTLITFERMVKIEINEGKFNVAKNSTILDAVNLAKAPYAKDCKIIAIKTAELIPETPKDFSIETTKGKSSIRIADPFLPIWLKHYRDFQGVKIGWTTRNVITFGPIDLTPSGLKPTRERLEYHRGDVFLSFGGFDPSQTHLCFSKSDHEGVYGPPQENQVIGKVISGGHIILGLGRGDSILRMYPSTVERKEVFVLRPEEIERKTVEDDMRILTYFEATLSPDAPNCAEHFLASVRDGFFKVDQSSTMFVCSERVGITPPKENTVYRPTGAITVRNSGTKAGAIYIYRKDAPFTPTHSVVGRITRGIELVEHVNPGDKILVETIPERLVVVGMTQGQATEYLTKRGIRHVRVKGKDDDAIIIEQRPRLTMEVRERGSAVTLGVKPGLITHVNLWDEDSPQSALHFRRVADMVHSPIGKLKVLEISKEMLILSSSIDTRTIKIIPPEKRPSEVVEEGAIGVTNSFRKLTGVIGVRLKADETYGPTGEVFEATNLIGRVTEGLDLLKNRNIGDTIYLREGK